MSTPPPNRPQPPVPGRPAPGAGPSSASTGVVIDPIKLIKKYKTLLISAAITGAVLGVIGHFVLMQVYPVWTPSAFYQCYPAEAKTDEMNPTVFVRDELERFMATQVQILMSDRIVDRVVNDPNLEREAPKWAAQFHKNGTFDPVTAARKLKKNLSAGIVGDSNLIRLSFWWTDENDSTAIVKLVGRTFVQDRQATATSETSDRKQVISQGITDTADQITKLQARRTRLLQEDNIDSLKQESNSVSTLIYTYQTQLADIRATKEQMISRRNSMQAELESPVGIQYPDEIRKLVEDDPTILRIRDERNAMEAELTALSTRVSPKHWDYIRLKSRLEAKELSLQVQREKLLRQYFDSHLDSIRQRIAGFERAEGDIASKLEELKIKAVTITQILADVEDITSEVERLNQSKGKYSEELKNVEILTKGRGLTRVQLLQDAQVPRTVTFPKLYLMLPLGVLAVLGLVGGSIVLFEVIDQRIKSPSDIGMLQRTRLLGIVPHSSEDPSSPERMETVFRDEPGGIMAEHFRQIRGVLGKRMQLGGHKTLLAVSGMAGSGATSVVCNLARAFAAADQRVLILDANFRRPTLHRALGLSEGPGLSDTLAGSKSLAEAVQKTDEPNLDVLTVGSPDCRKIERLATDRFTKLLDEAAAAYDLVLIDASPASVSGDAVALANRCDASILVIRAFSEKRGQVARLRNDLGETKAEFLGIILNGVRSSAGGYLKGNIKATHEYQTTHSTAA